MVRFFYNLFYPIGLLFFLPGQIRKLVRRGNYRHKLGQRFGVYDEEVRTRLAARRCTWIHAVSVGEVAIAQKLAAKLRQLDPEFFCVLTTTTTTGSTLPQIVYFNGPATANCPQGTAQSSVKLTWLTRRATIIQWKLDGQAINGPDQPGGSASFAFACAQPKHTYTLRASNTKGQYATFNVTVQRAG